MGHRGKSVGEVQHHQPGARPEVIQAAANELAERLRSLADNLGAAQTARRVAYGNGRITSSFRRRSPEGYLIDPVKLQMLLPDGRLWSYSRSDAQRFPAGRVYDARNDHAGFAGGRSFPAGTEFTFLGAVIGKYTFGFADGAETSSPNGLCALVSEGRAVQFVDVDQAFADLAHSLGSTA